ncbi:MAG TPA: carboxypeptidase-like regulatory domain-containing protein, partial [Candidatus Thermoplasmatota archaeon]|nr:carboxypeptidase-like regulatory domain-containing protein [Candidatus Thermoplasmatota archaeon]
FILTQYEPYEIEFIYGNRDSNYLHLTFYFYTNDQTSNFRNESIMYQSNIVENTVYYRIISWDNQTSRYALLYADQPGLGTQKHGIISFLDGTTLVGMGGTLDSNTYSDEQLKTMLDMVEEKARELLSIKSSMDELSGHITGFTRPMKHIKVSLSNGGSTTETTTDAGGYYNITNPLTQGTEYTLTVTFSYVIDTTTYFSLHYHENNATVVSLQRTFTMDSATDLTQDIALESELPRYYGGDWAKTFASMYAHFTEALELYKDLLRVNVDFQLPVDVYAFASEQTGTRYWYNIPGKSYITIDAEKSIHESVYRPMNREYHEFSHYIMHTLYQRWPAPEPSLSIGEWNHDGYLNPSTSDSYVEGFAEFMSAVIMEYYEQAGTSIAMIPPNEKDKSAFAAMDYMFNTQWNGKEIDCPAWADNGRSEETAVAGVLWDLYDDNSDYCDKTPAEMYQLYQQMLPQLQKDYEKYKADFEQDTIEYGGNATPRPFVQATLQDFEDYKYDDDNATLGLEAVWAVIKNFHNDFTSVYNDFISKYPAQKKVIDEVFIRHAFYVDTDPGNGEYDLHDIYRDENHNRKYDAGEYYVDCPVDGFHYTTEEVIGQATNYNRLWRQSMQEIPGYFIKVDNTVPFYLVKVSFPNAFYLDYVVRVWNENGMINIPVPPEGYASLVTVIPEGVQRSVPLSFTSDVFQRHYDSSLAQGYYVQHDFDITGPIPPLPSIPSDTGDTDNVPGQKTQTPGFEMIVFLAACALVCLLLKKTKRT